MKVRVNGIEKELKSGATLKDAVHGEEYVPGSLVSILLSTDKVTEETSDLELVTTKGSMTIRLDEGEDARIWKSVVKDIEGIGARWVTRNIAAFGSFRTKVKVSREARMYRRYDCFFSLGGFDSDTTYMMIAMDDHKGAYGAGSGRIGRITAGRHILKLLREGDNILSIKPVVSETSSDNVIVTSDPAHPMNDGMNIETFVKIAMDKRSPLGCEHLLIAARDGVMKISDSTGSYAACSDNTDVSMMPETPDVRSSGSVTVRSSGVGIGRIFFYKERRQLSTSHDHIGRITHGKWMITSAAKGNMITVRTDQERVLSVGMTQSEGKKFLEKFNVKQIRTGDTSDDAVIVEQEPEWTMHAIAAGEVETFGAPRNRIFDVSMNRKEEPATVHYFEKVTGLSHKPIGTMKVHFTFKGLPMITFDGDEERGKSLYPGEAFKKCKKGDIGVTNQSRPHCGLMGIRLEDSKEFGPTGEEPYGTNIFGTFKGDLNELMNGLKEGSIVYVREWKNER